jgi:hypothetical protein
MANLLEIYTKLFTELEVTKDIDSIFKELWKVGDLDINSIYVTDRFYSRGRYFLKKVSESVYNYLNTNNTDLSFSNGMIKKVLFGIDNFYDAIDSYEELRGVNWDLELKTKIYYNSVFLQVVENSLSHLLNYLCEIKEDLTGIKASKKTLADYLNYLSSEFKTIINDNINLRNAIGHGKIDFNKEGNGSHGYKINFTYRDGRNGYKTFSLYEFAYKKELEDHIDLVAGIIHGILKFLIHKNSFKLFNSGDLEINNFTLSSAKLKIQKTWFVNNADQLNIEVKSEIQATENNKSSLFDILTLYSHFYPEVSAFSVSVKHPFGDDGFIKLDRNNSAESGILFPCEVFENFNRREWLFFQYPEIRNNIYIVNDVSGSQKEEIKEANANVIFHAEPTLKDVRFYISEIVDQLKNVKIREGKSSWYGKVDHEIECNRINLNIYFDKKTRDLDSKQRINLSKLNNPSFICMVSYYKDSRIEKLSDNPLLNHLVKEQNKNCYFSCNPNFYKKFKK